MSIRDIVIEIIANTFVSEYPELDKSTLVKQLQSDDDLSKVELNSIQYIKTVIQIEERLEIEFDYDKLDYSEMESLSSLCKYIDSLVNGTGEYTEV